MGPEAVSAIGTRLRSRVQSLFLDCALGLMVCQVLGSSH